MIQRIQTVWLLLAALIMAGIFYVPIYKFSDGHHLSIGQDYVAIILAVISIVLSVVTIFRFKNRKAQTRMILLNILCCLILLGWLLYTTQTSSAQTPATSGYFRIGAFIPLACLILFLLALRGVRKDARLIKSMDHLR